MVFCLWNCENETKCTKHDCEESVCAWKHKKTEIAVNYIEFDAVMCFVMDWILCYHFVRDFDIIFT